MAGLTLRHHRGHLFRAVYEGIAFGIRQILEFLDDAVGAPERIVAVGGGTQGGLWTQIVTSDWSQVASRLEPEPANGAVYDELYGVYGELYPPPGRRSTGSPPSRAST